jgi:hypothetical protein
MKIKMALGLLMVLTVAALVTGCSQASAATPPAQVVTPAASAQTANTVPVKADASVPAPKPPDPAPAASVPAADAAPQLTRISEILQNPKVYSGKIVKVEGKITSECGSGCWFTIKDSSAVLYVDLAPNNMVIPQKRGSNARVIGEIVSTGSDIYMVGSKVEF